MDALQTAVRFMNSPQKDSISAFTDYIGAELRTLSLEKAEWAKSKLNRAFLDIMDEAKLMVVVFVIYISSVFHSFHFISALH